MSYAASSSWKPGGIQSTGAPTARPGALCIRAVTFLEAALLTCHALSCLAMPCHALPCLAMPPQNGGVIRYHKYYKKNYQKDSASHDSGVGSVAPSEPQAKWVRLCLFHLFHLRSVPFSLSLSFFISSPLFSFHRRARALLKLCRLALEHMRILSQLGAWKTIENRAQSHCSSGWSWMLCPT